MSWQTNGETSVCARPPPPPPPARTHRHTPPSWADFFVFASVHTGHWMGHPARSAVKVGIFFWWCLKVCLDTVKNSSTGQYFFFFYVVERANSAASLWSPALRRVRFCAGNTRESRSSSCVWQPRVPAGQNMKTNGIFDPGFRDSEFG